MNKTSYISILLFLFVSVSFNTNDITRIWLVGDSTMSIKQSKARPETGWGMPFALCWDSTVIVENKAMNGRSTRTFVEEGRWEQVVNALNAGDYVFIQFGHNDEVPTKKSYTKPDSFRFHLSRFINQVRDKEAIPVLLTPVSRRKFDSTGTALNTHKEYSGIVRELAAARHVFFIDLDSLSRQAIQEAGVLGSKKWFNHLQPGEHPNYPDGKIDDTHFNEAGAKVIAEIVITAIKDNIPLLAPKLRECAGDAQ